MPPRGSGGSPPADVACLLSVAPLDVCQHRDTADENIRDLPLVQDPKQFDELRFELVFDPCGHVRLRHGLATPGGGAQKCGGVHNLGDLSERRAWSERGHSWNYTTRQPIAARP